MQKLLNLFFDHSALPEARYLTACLVISGLFGLLLALLDYILDRVWAMTLVTALGWYAFGPTLQQLRSVLAPVAVVIEHQAFWI